MTRPRLRSLNVCLHRVATRSRSPLYYRKCIAAARAQSFARASFACVIKPERNGEKTERRKTVMYLILPTQNGRSCQLFLDSYCTLTFRLSACRQILIKTAHAHFEVAYWRLHVAVGALI